MTWNYEYRYQAATYSLCLKNGRSIISKYWQMSSQKYSVIAQQCKQIKTKKEVICNWYRFPASEQSSRMKPQKFKASAPFAR
jgi:hypothetical protein